ncbi:hypothetical protein HPULCUR_001775 [Helicostylum pulchrum]|uniref:C2H2-type domain-containing protein n=1 Tax=Helicostylum pulchrum TaxID=562976 RepID=A0ABP9XQG2_9FUNG
MYHPITTTFTNGYYSVPDNIHDSTLNKKEQDDSFNQGLLLTSVYYPNNHQHQLSANTSNASYYSRHSYPYDYSTYSPSSASNASLSPTDSTSYDFYPQFMDDHYFFQTDSIFKNEEWTLDSLLSSTEPVTKTNDVRPYPCHLCRRAFARKHDLQRHIRVHTGDKPYSCPCCKKAFARTDALKRHLRMEEHCRTSHEVLNMKKNGRHFRNLKIHTTT